MTHGAFEKMYDDGTARSSIAAALFVYWMKQKAKRMVFFSSFFLTQSSNQALNTINQCGTARSLVLLLCGIVLDDVLRSIPVLACIDGSDFFFSFFP